MVMFTASYMLWACKCRSCLGLNVQKVRITRTLAIALAFRGAPFTFTSTSTTQSPRSHDTIQSRLDRPKTRVAGTVVRRQHGVCLVPQLAPHQTPVPNPTASAHEHQCKHTKRRQGSQKAAAGMAKRRPQQHHVVIIYRLERQGGVRTQEVLCMQQVMVSNRLQSRARTRGTQNPPVTVAQQASSSILAVSTTAATKRRGQRRTHPPDLGKIQH